MSLFQAESTVLELPFYFNTPVSDPIEAVVSAPYPPFNTGTWKVSYAPSSSQITIECQDVVNPIKIVSAWLTTSLVPWVSGRDVSANCNLNQSAFPPSRSWSFGCQLWSPTASEKFQRVVRLQLSLPAAIVTTQVNSQPGLVARRNAVNFSSQSPNDVVFYFPRSKRELWANAETLIKASPYFDSLLAGGYKESEPLAPTADKPNRELTAQSDASVSLSQDSDDESDAIPIKLAATRTKTTLPVGIKQVIITDHTYTTYHAVFAWIYYDHVDFAPLSPPPFLPKPVGGDLNFRQAHVEAAAKAHPNLPLPASPKSVYQLAQLVELPDLAAVALASFKSQLTIDNVLYELTTSVAFDDAACAAIEEFALANWDAVRRAPAALALEKSEVLDALPDPTEAGARLFKLARRCAAVAG